MRLIAIIIAALAVASPAVADKKFCPPGLAKKSPACVPPGQAKKGYQARRGDRHQDDGDHYGRRDWRRGDRLQEDSDYVILRDPHRYDLPPIDSDDLYYRRDDSIILIDRETREIIQLFRILRGDY